MNLAFPLTIFKLHLFIHLFSSFVCVHTVYNSIPVLAAESGASVPPQDSRTTSPDLFESQPLTSASSKPSSARKTPESFLGPNAALVNLDSLVTKPAPPAQSLNPFLAPGKHVLGFINCCTV